MCLLKVFLIYSSGGHFVQEWIHLYNFGRGHYEEHFCEIILNLNQWFEDISIIRSGSHFV